MNISEVCRITGLTSDTLRYYEKIGIIVDVNRTPGGKRAYSQQNLNQIKFVSCMKKSGCSLQVIKRYMDLLKEGEDTKNERIDLLQNQKNALLDNLNEIKESIEYLDAKIEFTKIN